LNFEAAAQELYRLLAPDGVILAVEPLNYNPILKLHRWITPQKRTQYERAFTIRDIRSLERWFRIDKMRSWFLFSPVAGLFRHTPLFRAVFALAQRMDSFLLEVRPFSLLAWMVSFELRKTPHCSK
jgi:SAM-dependent methyltransferase